MNYLKLLLITSLIFISCNEENKNADDMKNQKSEIVLLENFKSEFITERNIEIFQQH